ncbi:MAG: tRNA 2-selenouridine(34) synthase MnmH [Burkholderiales bacterium]|nr:tRNA 2-selenouridine(34) synthase MnmH [Burkholderiales bacterium]MDE2298768.1 tRNA 2-selenouridine(34) synthase MnmH [Burkholderiales bacterium]MDE2626009.1 tRNA 2-selenouridine(34) synthase MnmH [Burkholderiales bacterium]
MLLTLTAAQALSRLEDFDTVIDARSQSEYAQDCVPGAVNWPTLNDAERHLVGTEYKQVSAFTAKKRGAALAARNIAEHIERHVIDKPKEWRPLVYCWRGGSRSNSLALVLDQIGFRVHRLEGGYQQFRRAVVGALDVLPRQFEYRVVCGTTGSGKSRLLQVLRTHAAQVIDLEALANHRGSVLGLVPGERQPGQKQFESRVWDALRRLDPARPVYIESESKKVGDLRVPQALVERMRASPCLQLELPLDARVALLNEEYDFFVRDAEAFCARLDALRTLRGHAQVDRWQAAARGGSTSQVVRELLIDHYDPIYLQSMARNFAGITTPRRVLQWDGSAASLGAAAEQAIAAG